jgi:methyl-accepting chemotaxis protein
MNILSLLKTVTEWFIPETNKKDFLVFRQSKIIVYFSFMGIFFYAYNIIKWYNLNIFLLAGSLSVIVGLTALMLFFLKFTGQYKIVAHTTVIALFFHFSFLTYFDGGLDAKSIYWLLLIPMISYIIVGSKPALVWFFIVLAEMTLFSILKSNQYVFPGLGLTEAESFKEQIIGIVGPLCAQTLGIFLFETLNKITLKEMENSRLQTQDSVDLLREILESMLIQAEALSESSQSLLENGNMVEGTVSETSGSVSKITALVNDLSSLSEKVVRNSSKVLATSKQGLRTTENGMASAEEMKTKMSQIERSSETSIKEIVELNEHSKKINNIMNIINNIADQTKLIAFNASLEASSAGEAGKRFSVVAVEIRRLADNVMESTSEIRATIKNINESVERLLIYSEKGSSDIQQGINSLNGIVTILSQILTDAKIQSDLAKDIILNTDEQANINDQVLQKTIEISNGTNKTSQSVTQSGIIATSLASIATELKQQMKKT